MLTAQQLKERKGYIGGSDCAAVLGLSRYKTPLEVWADKTGKVQPDNIDDKICIRLGNVLEDVVRDMFTEVTEKVVERENKTLFHPRFPFLAANIDGWTDNHEAILECKTASLRLSQEWLKDEIPQEYLLQVYHYLAVTGAKRAYVAVLIGNDTFKHKVVERDERIIGNIIDREVRFWQEFVQAGIPPAVTRDDGEVLYKLFKSPEPETVVEMGDDAARICESLEGLRADAKDLEGRIDKAENELKALIGNAEAGMTGGYMITWKPQEQERVDTARLKKDYPDIAKECMKKLTFRKLAIKTLKPRN